MEAVQEIALPKIKGSPVDQLPENLYVPPKALLLLLDVFSGPMDFLLYLIQRKNLDILEVNLVDITDQYIAYIEMMEDFEYELAGDYLAMAAYLAEIKSRICSRCSKIVGSEATKVIKSYFRDSFNY